MISEATLSQDSRRVLDLIQSHFPLANNPYTQLGRELDLPPERVHQTVLGLRHAGIIRRIGGSYVPARLGYSTSLIAAAVAPERLEAVALRAGSFPNVTHNYEREGRLNLWFTVIAPSPERIQELVAEVALLQDVHEIHILPALQTFKLRVRFPFVEGVAGHQSDHKHSPHPNHMRTSRLELVDKRLIARTCGDIGTGRTPFTDMAGELGIPRDELLERLHGYCRNGLMRRFGAIIRHYSAGFTANGMSVWNVPDEQTEEIGTLLSSRTEISHCYERPRAPRWPYNLYAMAHARQKEHVRNCIRHIATQAGVADYRILFSRREFKKASMVYFASE